MKQFILFLVIAVLLMSFTACKRPVTEQNGNAPDLASSDAPVVPLDPELTGYEAKDGTKYIKWTSSNWNQADAEEKKTCAITYLIMTDPEIVKVSEEAFNKAVEDAVIKLDKAFRNNLDQILEDFIN